MPTLSTRLVLVLASLAMIFALGGCASMQEHGSDHEHHHGADTHTSEHDHHHGADAHSTEHEHHHGDDGHGSEPCSCMEACLLYTSPSPRDRG